MRGPTDEVSLSSLLSGQEGKPEQAGALSVAGGRSGSCVLGYFGLALCASEGAVVRAVAFDEKLMDLIVRGHLELAVPVGLERGIVILGML